MKGQVSLSLRTVLMLDSSNIFKVYTGAKTRDSDMVSKVKLWHKKSTVILAGQKMALDDYPRNINIVSLKLPNW